MSWQISQTLIGAMNNGLLAVGIMVILLTLAYVMFNDTERPDR